MSAAIRVTGLTLGRGWGPRPPPLDLEVPEGSFAVLESSPARFGPLLRVCVGLQRPLLGTVEVLGHSVPDLSRRDLQRLRRRLGVGLRPGGLTSNLTVRMNVATPLLYGGISDGAAATRRTEEMVDACGLAPWADLRPDDVPPDVRQACVIARAVARRPELLILEDPLSALDAQQAERLLEVCRTSAGTILITTRRARGALEDVADLRATWTTQQQAEQHEVGAN